MLISEAIQQVQVLSQGDTDYPTSGDDDFGVYLAALNAMINQWETEKGVSWNELFWKETGVLAFGDNDYSLDTDVKWPAGLLTIDGTPINFNKPEESHLSEAMGFAKQNFFVSGPVGLKVLEIAPSVLTSQNGATWKLPCCHAATRFVTGAETTPIQMSDPYFAIHGAVALISIEDNPTLAGVHQQFANEKLIAMRIANEAKPMGSQEDHYDQTYAGFGR